MRLSDWQLSLMKEHLSESGGRDVMSSHRVGCCSLVVVAVAERQRMTRAVVVVVAKRVVNPRWPLRCNISRPWFASEC